MKTTHFIAWVSLLLFTFACKTNESQERIISGNRSEMEAIINKHLRSMESSVTVDYEQFHQALLDDALVEHIDLARFESCIRNMVVHSNKRLTSMRASGCEALMKQSLEYSDHEAIAFHEKNASAWSRCDSIRAVLIAEYTKEVIRPFGELLENARKRSGDNLRK